MSSTPALTTPEPASSIGPTHVLLAANDLINLLVQNHTPLHIAVKLFRTAYVEAALIHTGGNNCAAARLIQAHRNTTTRHRPKA